jgi:hypothetical protein
MDFDRDTLASAIVGTGGAWLLGSALYQLRAGRPNATQIRGLVLAGLGFLMSAGAARWLQHTGPRGVAVSLLGTIFAMRGMYLLVRDRVAGQGAHPGAPPPPPRGAACPPEPPTSD